MSIDGPGIIASDLAHDTYNEILDLYDADLPIDEIRSRIASCERELQDEMELEIYLAASAKAFWEIGHLKQSHIDRLAHLVDSGASLALWDAPGDSLAKKRKTALDNMAPATLAGADPIRWEEVCLQSYRGLRA